MPQPRRAGLSTLLWATLLAGTASPAPAASAATATSDQAQAIERFLHDRIENMLGGTIALPDRPVQLRAEGDDYALIIPLGTDSAITGHLTPQDDGRWLLSGVKLPSPATFTLSLPAPAKSGQPPAMVQRTYAFSVARQTIGGRLDPSNKTPSNVEQRYEGFQLSSSGGGVKQTSQIARSSSQATSTPTADGRFDLTSSSVIEGYLDDNENDNGFAVHLAAERNRLALQFGSISPDKYAALLRSSVAFVQAVAAANGAGRDPDRFTTEQQAHLRTVLRALVEALDGFASTMQADDAIENLQVQAGKAAASYGGIARRASLGFGAEAPDGVLKTYLDVGVEGLSIPGVLATLGVPAQYAGLVPTDIHLRPTLAGIGTKELLDAARRALDAMDRGEKPPPPDPAPLFAHGGIVAGLDAMSFNLGPTKFAGQGAVTVTAPSPSALTGQGRITATDFDALVDRAKQDPAMQSALALLTFVKGIGRNSGDQIVWDITYRDGRTLVNGVDAMAMAGAASEGGRANTPPPSLSGKPPPK